MTTELNNHQDQNNQNNQDQKDKKNEKDEAVTLSKKDYEKLLDHIDGLEERLLKPQKGKKERDEVDELADEGRQRRGKKGKEDEEEIDLNDLDNKDLARLIVGEVNTWLVQPLLVNLHRMDVELQIERLMQKPEYKDFWDYGDEIYAIAKENPKLPLSKVYKLAKEEFEQSGKRKPAKRNDDEETPEETARRLRRGSHDRKTTDSEKPGGSKKAFDEKGLSVKDAASRAWDEVVERRK